MSTEKLNTITSTLDILLNTEFVDAYVLFKRNRTNNQYKNRFYSVVDTIETELRNLFNLSNDIHTETVEMNNNISTMNIQIDDEKKKNQRLKRELGIIDDAGVTSKELINDYKNIYDIRYLRNWAIVLAILAVGFSTRSNSN
jgi:peptidoglycan hydrolase CwlO-like protein